MESPDFARVDDLYYRDRYIDGGRNIEKLRKGAKSGI